MNRDREERVNNIKHYLSEGEFRTDIWRVLIPVLVVAALAVWLVIS